MDLSCVSSTVAPKRLAAAPPEKQRQISKLVQQHGVSATARQLGIGRDSTRRLACGEAVTLATLTLALQRLSPSL